MINKNELPKNWEVKKLGDIVTKQTLKALPLDAPDAKFIGMDCIEPNGLMPTFLYDFKDFKSAGNRFESGQVLYGRMRPYLNKVYKAAFDGVCSGEFIVLKCLPFFTPDLLQYILHSRAFVRFVNSKTSGDRPRISFDEISDYPISLPPLAEQERIVAKIEELFSELDAGIASLKTAQAQLKIYRQAVLKYAFEGKLTNDNVNEGELPKGWKWERLGKVIEQPKYGTSKKCDYNFDGHGVLRIPNIASGFIDSTDLKFAEFDEKEIETYSLKVGDLLTIRSNGSVDLVGKCALIANKDEGFLYAGYLIRLRPLAEKLNSKFLLNVLSSSNLRNQIESKAKSTSGVNNINSEELKSLIIPLCSLEEQQRIVEEIESRLSVCDKVEETIAASLKQSEALRQSILKKAFEGKLF